MRRISGKTSRLFKAPLKSLECRVQHVDQAADLIRRASRGNSFVESFGRYALGGTPNIFNRCKRNRSEPPAAGGNQEQNDWYNNHEAASDFPAELLDILQIRANVQSELLIAKYPDPNGSSTDLASVKGFYSICQDRFA